MDYEEQPVANTASGVAVTLRPVDLSDLPRIFEFESDAEANRVAVVRPRTHANFEAHWGRVLQDPDTVARTILSNGVVVGTANCFPLEHRNWVGYWVAREYWGQGIATAAVSMLLKEVTTRPLFARIAMSNIGSARVAVRCGFRAIGTRMSPETDRFPACRETTYRLDS